MKTEDLDEEEIYTFKDVSKLINQTVFTIRARADVLQIPKRYITFRGNVTQRYFYANEVKAIKEKTRMDTVIKKSTAPKYLIIERIIEIYPSKLNYTPINQL